MKNKTKRNYLLGVILSAFLIAWIINITNGITINTQNIPQKNLHRISLFSLFLSNNDEDPARISVTTWWENLDILNWLIINNNSAWVAGWTWNKVQWENWAIGWWKSNRVKWTNWVVAGWYNNNSNGWIILWWNSNTSSKGWIVLWGQDNTANDHSIALWENANWKLYSFAWNGEAPEYSARINASGGMLIWTYTPIPWVSLVVSWATKLREDDSQFDLNGDWKFDSTEDSLAFNICLAENDPCGDLNGDWKFTEEDNQYFKDFQKVNNWKDFNFNTWWIRIAWNWCIKYYDWNVNYNLGRNSETECWSMQCKFGSIVLHDWDKVQGYSKYYAENCVTETITCKNWNLYIGKKKVTNNIYPTCYELSPSHRAELWD